MIYIGADHKGYELKAKINKWLAGREFEFEDMGAFDYDSTDDYVDFSIQVGQKVAKAPEAHRGILICGSGVGVTVAANKVRGVRCGLGFKEDQVHAARKEDNINVLAISSENTDEYEAFELVEKFLETEFAQSDRYLRRIEKIIRYEKESASHK